MKMSAQEVVEVERHIAARPETVFAYFTDPERFIRWQGTDAQLDPRPGGLFRVTVTGKSRVVARGRYVEVDPPRRIVFTWGWEQLDGLPEGMDGLLPGTSTVEVTLIPEDGGTVLKLRQTGLRTDPEREIHLRGWDQTLDRLVVVAAGGDPGPDPMAEL